MLKRVAFAGVVLMLARVAAAAPLTIYFIDVEGGQATLIVAPDKHALLVDSGYAGNGGRDAGRVIAAARDAGVTRLDYLLVTHFHGDHAGAVPEVAARLRIGAFVDYDRPRGGDESALVPFGAYAQVRARATHLVAKPGLRLTLGDAAIEIVSAGGITIAAPLAGAGGANAACRGYERHADDPSENARSVGFRLAYGAFRFLDLGDLNWNPLGRLTCPTDLVGRVDLFLVPHHTNVDSAVPAMLAAIRPRAIVSNNGPTKGGTPAALALVHAQPDADVWQLHKSNNAGAVNSDDALLANVDDGQTGYWIKATANADGSFSVANARTGSAREYRKR